MKPTDVRDQNFNGLIAGLDAGRMRVYNAWCNHCPGTTRGVAMRSGIDILTFRPRSTELYQAGLLMIIDSIDGQGIYRVRLSNEWEAWHAGQIRTGAGAQLQML